MERRVKLKMNKKKIAIIGVAAFIVIIILAAALAPQQSQLDLKIDELKNEGYNVQFYPGTFAEAKAERPSVIFLETTDWQTFKLQIAATKEDIGFTTVWVHEDEGILWVARSENTYYYYQVTL